MNQKTLVWILKIGVFSTLVCTFFVFKNFLFPYITSKQLPFNILVEILAFFWLWLIIRHPEWRPKKSWVSAGLSAYFAVVLITAFTGVDFNLSFWGDIERMLGWFHIAHFLVLYYIIITVFRTWKDWHQLFIASIAAAAIQSFYLLSANNGYGTIGNTAYVSGYLIFNIYFCLILFFRAQHRVLRWFYLLPLPLFIMAFKTADTSGAYVGLGASLFAAVALYGLLYQNRKVKIATMAMLILMAAGTYLMFAYKNTQFVKDMPLIGNVVRDVDFQKNTFQTRLISWKAAGQDWKNSPKHVFLGTGFGNYAITFDKYFDPQFYIYTNAETYFDRAHNNLIDIANTTGIFGLLAYLFIFLAAAFYMIRGYRQGTIGLYDFILVSSLVIAYFVQNLAVFDSFVTYLSLMALLGYIVWLSGSKKPDYVPAQPIESGDIAIMSVIGLVIAAIIYQYNIKPMRMLDYTIAGQQQFAAGNIEGAMASYKQALAFETGLDRDSRTSFIRSIASNGQALEKMDDAKAQEIIAYTLELGEKNLAYNPQDSLMQLMMSQAYNLAAALNSANKEKFAFYSGLAEEAVNKSIDASPGRVPTYYTKAQIQLTRGEKDRAIETLRHAVSLKDTYSEGFCQLGRVYLYYQMQAEGREAIGRCVDLGGASMIQPATFAKAVIDLFNKEKDYGRALKVFEVVAAGESTNIELQIGLARAYANAGEIDKAIEHVGKIVEIEPKLQSSADEFIADLRQASSTNK